MRRYRELLSTKLLELITVCVDVGIHLITYTLPCANLSHMLSRCKGVFAGAYNYTVLLKTAVSKLRSRSHQVAHF